jgi:hypothetical protein
MTDELFALIRHRLKQADDSIFCTHGSDIETKL